MTLSDYTCRGFHALLIIIAGYQLYVGAELLDISTKNGGDINGYGLFLVIVSVLVIFYSLVGLFWGIKFTKD